MVIVYTNDYLIYIYFMKSAQLMKIHTIQEGDNESLSLMRSRSSEAGRPAATAYSTLNKQRLESYGMEREQRVEQTVEHVYTSVPKTPPTLNKVPNADVVFT